MKKIIRTVLFKLYPEAVPVLSTAKHTNNLVLLLGWAGSKQRNMQKLLRDYQDLGIPTICHVMPLFFSTPGFVRTFFENEIARKIAEEMKDRPNCKLFVHSYSNNGVWVYGTLCRRAIIPQPSKVILDAAPALHYEYAPVRQEAEVLSRIAVSTMLRKDIYEHKLWTPIFNVAFTGIIAIARLCHALQGDRNIVFNPVLINRYLRDQSPVVPMLLIHSTGDRLVPSGMIQDFKMHLVDRGAAVEELIFGEDVAHTGSYYSDPKRYFEAVKKFFQFDFSSPGDEKV